eukprot:m.76006 g.76006  ORF g.76006 m.76006 type:complete len:390 (-) comp12537_c0_seq5:133-1302(-)
MMNREQRQTLIDAGVTETTIESIIEACGLYPTAAQSLVELVLKVSKDTQHASGAELGPNRKRPKLDNGIVATSPQSAGHEGPALATASNFNVSCPGTLTLCVLMALGCFRLTKGARGRLEIKFCEDSFWFQQKGNKVTIQYSNIAQFMQVAHPIPQKKQIFFLIILKEKEGKIENVLVTFKEKEKLQMQLEPKGENAKSQSLLDTIKKIDSEHVDGVEWFNFMFKNALKCTQISASSPPIPCHLKVTEGFIMLLKYGVLFFPSKLTWISIHQIQRMEINGATQHTFQLEIDTHDNILYEFMIPREQEQGVQEYLRVQAKNATKRSATEVKGDANVSRSASNKGGGSEQSGDEEEASSDEDDNDFDPTNQSDSCEEEYDSNYQGSSSDGE